MSGGNPTVIATLNASGGSASNFLPDDAIDLTYLSFATGDTVTLGANNVLDVLNASGTLLTTVQLDAATNYGSYIFTAVTDGKGGTEIVNPLFSDNLSTYTEGNDWTAPTTSGWTVASGSVDMCGPSNQNYSLGKDPLSGLTTSNYFDLDGSTSTPGVLATKQSFAAGTYTLHFDLAGDQRSTYNNGSGTTNISLGSWSTSLTLKYNVALKEYSYTFTTTKAGALTFAEASASNNNVGNLLESVQLLAVACYLRGTRLLTDKGEAAIETLQVGDLLITASGAARPIKWLGRRSLDVARYAGDVADILPVCVAQGAFGPNLPARDLWISPDHNIAFEGALIPARILLNGKTICQHERRQVEYWHVELDQHDVIFAEGLASESYLDTGNRSAFENGGDVIDAFPDFAPKHWSQTCLPLAFEGEVVALAKTVLLERLADQGMTLTRDADLHIMADGARIAPLQIGPERFVFVIPSQSQDIAIMSRCFVPAHALAQSADRRTLGVSVHRLQLDAEDVALGSPMLGEGWHEFESYHRWTDGCARLPANTRLVALDVVTGQYWREPRNNVVALFG